MAEGSHFGRLLTTLVGGSKIVFEKRDGRDGAAGQLLVRVRRPGQPDAVVALPIVPG